ncbi:MAG: hypothetical protein IJ325_10235 [Clostridia bacterium]|nr:hypothetical protein [Clostridia bacterium]
MKEKKQIKGEKGTAALAITVTVCTLFLLILLLVTVILTSATSGILNSTSPLDPSVLLSEEESSAASIKDSIIPAFIGIGTEESRKGISAGDNVVRELYALLTPYLVNGLCTEPERVESFVWKEAISTYPYVFVQYHSPMPIEFLQATGAQKEEEMAVGENTLLAESLLLKPGFAGSMLLLVKITDGTVLRYSCDSGNREEFPTMDTLSEWVQNFPNNFYRYELRFDGMKTEPVFLERIRVQNVTMAAGSLEMLESNDAQMGRFLRLLDFNPDKLSKHTESDGTSVLVESHGILQYCENWYRYIASSDGGVPISSVIGNQDYYTVYDIIRTACTIAERLRNASQYYLGGEAELVLTSCETTGDTVTLTFSYAFDNLLISEYDPALVLTVSDTYRILSLQITSIAVTGWGEYRTVYTESGIHDQNDGKNKSVFLTYPSDFYAEAVFPVWTVCTPVDVQTGE